MNIRKFLICLIFIFFLSIPAYVQDKGGGILITDFEDPVTILHPYSGPLSQISAVYQSEIVFSGKSAIKLEYNSRDWSGVYFKINAERGYWQNYKLLSIQVYGNKSGSRINIQIEDFYFEGFLFSFIDDFSGWRKISIPVNDFVSNPDWQNPLAIVNRKIDYPVRTMNFSQADQGKNKICFDLIKVTENKTDSEWTDPPEYAMRELADKAGICFGTALEAEYLSGKLYKKTLLGNFNMVTPENAMKWEVIHPQQDTFNFLYVDRIVEFAREYNLDVRGHTLIWHIQNPDWLVEKNWSEEELSEIMEQHINAVVGRYRGEISVWDVCNEIFNENGQLRDTLWMKALGRQYIAKAFYLTHLADPDAKLIINDYNIEEKNAKSDAMYKLVKNLLSSKTPIHGIGVQFHLNMENLPDFNNIYQNLKRFSDLGIEIHFTEIDVRFTGQITPGKLEIQASVYKQLLELFLRLKGCTVFTIWGFTDAYSWIPYIFPDAWYPLIFDEHINPKPAFHALREVLETASR